MLDPAYKSRLPKLTKEQYSLLQKYGHFTGSRLFGTNSKISDYDYVISEELLKEINSIHYCLPSPSPVLPESYRDRIFPFHFSSYRCLFMQYNGEEIEINLIVPHNVGLLQSWIITTHIFSHSPGLRAHDLPDYKRAFEIIKLSIAYILNQDNESQLRATIERLVEVFKNNLKENKS